MDRLHTNRIVDIARSLQTGEPITALCGYTRTIDADKHDRIFLTAPACKHCERIGRTRYKLEQPPPRMSAGAILIYAQRQTYWWTFTVSTNGINTTVTNYPPLAA